MNRLHRPRRRHGARVPHERGDEPFTYVDAVTGISVFPTSVGMNRRAAGGSARSRRVPHERGDEPLLTLLLLALSACSPRAWG